MLKKNENNDNVNCEDKLKAKFFLSFLISFKRSDFSLLLVKVMLAIFSKRKLGTWPEKCKKWTNKWTKNTWNLEKKSFLNLKGKNPSSDEAGLSKVWQTVWDWMHKVSEVKSDHEQL